MSADTRDHGPVAVHVHDGHGAHDHAADAHGYGHDHHGHDDHGDDDHGSYKSYWIGFILSVVLTAIPFWLVMTGPLSNATTALIIMAFAVVQIVVHMIFFLHMNRSVEGGWSMMAMLFTLVVIVITLAGSLWVMYHMNTNMMPMQPGMEQGMEHPAMDQMG